ncbi:hypothetical protein ACFSCX_22590 [Bacillus salitolerans]|uniref:Uncharacterized protein n=1 Tax=Bacillus salitolerans TaxID=1437434 RepID=A0ABW4LYI3_9BACI
MYYPREQAEGYYFPFPIPGYPGGPGHGDGNVNRRLDRLERQVERLTRRIDRLDRRVDRIERRLGMYGDGNY